MKFLSCRFTSSFELHSSSNGAFVTYCITGYICHYHLCYCWLRAVLRENAQDMF